ncbi:diaminopropionate ammonia-lyase [Algihabitans albus]|uniref:diaminopropionate ammonia-lyase n=1 Tax=Algihabitans albus TaxID=2164067 RepID=UPI001F3ADEF5|nr:diaminopropionate ammonia-lyase [Algihabitans albus]
MMNLQSTSLSALASEPLEIALNPKGEPSRPYGARQSAILNRAAFETAQAEIAGWPGYRPTPLVRLPGLAGRLGLAEIAYKDEGGRFGLGSFKALGGAYAVLRLLQRRLAEVTGTTPSTAEILKGQGADLVSSLTVCCATDGNHGRSVAWGAQTFGCRCVIFVHGTVSQGRVDAIARYGAEVRRVPGTYDEAVREAAREAEAQGWTVVSDTSYPGYMDIPRDVMQGYAVMAEEALAQCGDSLPTHVLVQAGVGGMAAAICAHLWETLEQRRPRFVAVEPDEAACLLASVQNGTASHVTGELDTIMAGLACGETSLLAWDILDEGADAFMTVTDASAREGMRLLAEGCDGDPPLVAGESAVAGLCAAIGALARPRVRESLGLGPDSRILLFGSEGDTDPRLYSEIVGRSGDEVRTKVPAE